MKRMHAIVEGRVHGVGYRDYVRTQAKRLQVTGWVRNLPDDRVEVLAEGEDVAITHLELLLEKGPPLSRIDDVYPTYSAPNGEFSDFIILL